MPDGLDLPLRHRRKIQALLAKHLPEAEVWAHGSRIDGRGHGGSDLDLVLSGPGLLPIPADRLARLRDAFRDSSLPILVEAHDWARLPGSFRRGIELKHVVVTRP